MEEKIDLDASRTLPGLQFSRINANDPPHMQGARQRPHPRYRLSNGRRLEIGRLLIQPRCGGVGGYHQLTTHLLDPVRP